MYTLLGQIVNVRLSGERRLCIVEMEHVDPTADGKQNLYLSRPELIRLLSELTITCDEMKD